MRLLNHIGGIFSEKIRDGSDEIFWSVYMVEDEGRVYEKEIYYSTERDALEDINDLREQGFVDYDELSPDDEFSEDNNYMTVVNDYE